MVTHPSSAWKLLIKLSGSLEIYFFMALWLQQIDIIFLQKEDITLIQQKDMTLPQQEEIILPQ